MKKLVAIGVIMMSFYGNAQIIPNGESFLSIKKQFIPKKQVPMLPMGRSHSLL